MRIATLAIAAAVLAATVLAVPGGARADDLVGYGRFGTGVAGMYGQVGDEVDATVIRSQFAGGMIIDDFSIEAGFVMGFLESSNFMRDGRDLLSLEYGPDVAYYLPWPHEQVRMFAGAGFHRVWWSGSTQVQRTCEQTGDCTAGFFSENPSYSGYTGKLTTGIHFAVPVRQRADRGNKLYMAFTLDVSAERMWIDIINDTYGGTLLSASLGIRIGGGRYGNR